MSDSQEIIQKLMSDVQSALEESQFQRAEAIVLAALAADPDNKEALKILAGLKFLAGDDVLAFATYKDAIQADGPIDAESLHGMASIMLRLGRAEEALPVVQQALTINPSYVPALYDLGVIYARQGQLSQAVDAFMTVSHHEPSHKAALINCAAAFVRLGKFTQAIQWYGQVLKEHPKDAMTWSNLGLVYRLLGVLEEARGCQTKALELEPDTPAIHWNNANVLLSDGRYEEGFREYEWRLRRQQAVDKREIDLPRWTGEALRGQRVFVSAEQGLGDMIQFSRFVRGVRDRGGVPIIELHPGLVPLFAAQTGYDIHRLGEPLPKADLTVPMMSLPHVLGVGMEDLPAYPPILQRGTDRPKGLPDAPLLLGFVWRGNKAHEYDALRSFDLETMLRFLEHPSITLVSLQADVTADEQSLLAEKGILDAGSRLGSFQDTARWMAPMDLVVSADTAALHLAASMGVASVLVLNRFRDWRWLTRRTDSPWYPDLTVLQLSKRGLDVFVPGVRSVIQSQLGLEETA